MRNGNFSPLLIVNNQLKLLIQNFFMAKENLRNNYGCKNTAVALFSQSPIVGIPRPSLTNFGL